MSLKPAQLLPKCITELASAPPGPNDYTRVPSLTRGELFVVHDDDGSFRFGKALAQELRMFTVYGLPPVVEPVPLRTIQAIAQRLVALILSKQPEGPYRVVGCGCGGVLAYEVATQLVGRDLDVQFAAVVGPPNAIPHEINEASSSDELSVYWKAAAHYSPMPVPFTLIVMSADGVESVQVQRWRTLSPKQRWSQFSSGMRCGSQASSTEQTTNLAKSIARELQLVSQSPVPLVDGQYRPLIPIQVTRSSGAPMFCIPGAGANATSFVQLADALDRSLPVYGFQPRGLDGVLVPHSTVESAAKCYLRSLESVCGPGPAHLLGHSFGGWVAFEMALRLQKAGREVGSLTIIDSEVPDTDLRSNEYDDVEAILLMVETLEQLIERPMHITAALLSDLGESDRRMLLHSRLVAAGLMPSRSLPEDLLGPLRTFSANVRCRYSPSEVYKGKTHLILVGNARQAERARSLKQLLCLSGWKQWAPELVAWQGPGNHMTALKQPHVLLMANWLRRQSII